jgi:RNA polymerase sigma-70 factor (ECF subfamily)
MSAEPSNASRFLAARGTLLGYLHACVRNPHDAEDLLQDVFLVVQQAQEQFQDDAAFLRWALTVCRHRVLEHHRKSRRLVTVEPEMFLRLEEATVRVALRLPDTSREDKLLSCLERLPPAWQQMIEMRYAEPDRPVSEIAARFGRSLGRMYELLKQIRARLRECADGKRYPLLSPGGRP